MSIEIKHTDLTFFTNAPNNTLLDRFRTILKDVEFFNIIVGYFRVSGFYQLYKSFENIAKIRILVGLNTDKQTIKIINTSQIQGKLDFETHQKTKETIGKKVIYEIEKSDDSQEVEEGIYKFIEYLKSGKIEIKAHPSQRLHAKVYICRYFKEDRDIGCVITGSSNFSEPGLVDNYEFNVQLKDSRDIKYASEKFEQLWSEAVDISEHYIETIQTKTHLNKNISPYQIYLKLLYEHFKADLTINREIFYQNIPEGFMKLKYQEQAVINAKKILDEYGGVFLADVVGLGKTYMAALLANQLQGRNLVIASPALLTHDNPNSWKNVFYNFRVPAEFESIGKLEKIIERGTDRYDNVFIDEAHKFRNENNISYENLAKICHGKKVILITATPLNNSPLDILAQIKLFQKARNSTIPGIKNLEYFFNNLQKKLKNLDRKNNYDKYMEIVKNNAQQIRDKVLKYIMIRRTRKEIETYFKDDLKNQGLKFPIINPPEPIFYQLDSKLNNIFMKTISLITDKEKFKYARYTPLLYLKMKITDFEKTSQHNMKGFMKILLIKRLESSFFAFNNTLERFINSYEIFLNAYNKGKVYISKKYWKKIMDYFLSENYDAIQKLIDNEKAEVYNKEDFLPQLKTDIETDLRTLKTIKKLWENINYDPKLESFINKIKEQPILQQNKIVIFTESTETAEYLSQNLKKRLNEKILLYHGKSSYKTLNTVISNFDAKATNKKNYYRILITTEVLSEGINLHRSNVVINYDIPWNPTRMIQRVGRINRVDTPFDKIYTYNFFPTETTNDIIKLKEAAIAKINYFIEMLGNDAKLLTDGEEIKSFELFNKLTSKKFIIGDENDEQSELKYLRIIENIRDNKKKLFDTIKQLPRKARVARKANSSFNSNKNALVTYFRKGNLEKFYMSTESKSIEIDFITTAKLFEAKATTQSQKIPPIFYKLLENNKEQIKNDLYELEEITYTIKKRGKDYITRIIKILNSKEMKNNKNFTKLDKEFLGKIKILFNEGTIPKSIAKRIFTKISKQTNPIKILNIIKQDLPKQFLDNTTSEKNNSSVTSEEIILSEYIIK